MTAYGVTDYNAAAANASRLLKNDKVSQEIKERFEARAMKADEVIDRLSQIARGDIGEYIDDYGVIDIAAARKAKKTHLLKKVKQRTIRKMEGTEDIEIHDVEFEAYSSHEALKDMAKFHALFTDKTRTEDWRTDLIALLRKGDVSPEIVLRYLDPATANDLFKEAGVKVLESSEV